jgi:hypothetical protein
MGVKRNSGLYWHVHHERLFEYCYDAKGRIDYIKAEKPKNEIATRLRLMRPIKGKLGDSKALAAYDKAWAAYSKARVAYSKARVAYSKAGDAYDKAGDAYDKAGAAYSKARDAYMSTIKPVEAEALHAKECKKCPWDGHTIFPKNKS